tara:strand:- start:6363 stop:6545 length:183 start_codon:yes stop_codon:yes gene_type:complete
MTKKKISVLKGLVDKQKSIDNKDAIPVNLEALVNSGRIRIGKDKLENIPDKSQQRKKNSN